MKISTAFSDERIVERAVGIRPTSITACEMLHEFLALRKLVSELPEPKPEEDRTIEWVRCPKGCSVAGYDDQPGFPGGHRCPFCNYNGAEKPGWVRRYAEPAKTPAPQPTNNLAVKPSNRDWPEDFTYENGRYENICCKCGLHFNGYKRRVACKICSSAPQPTADQKTYINTLRAYCAEISNVGERGNAAMKIDPLRFQAAVAAMSGQVEFEGLEGCDKNLIAGMSVEMADALIAELRKTGEQ